MSSNAFYLKYRPQSLDELIGQTSVKESILGAFNKKRLPHAYLFVGPKGTGKTSTARILAKMVNCEKRESRVKSQESSEENSRLSTLVTSDFPCNKCVTCLSITDGSNLDLIEIDAASNRGVEDIRSLREKIKLSPTSSKKKVYIIDECHMLTQEAFNALLKTLEEPPSHALFILATTDAQKLPETIISRVQRLDFKKASKEDLMQNMADIIKKEGIDVEDSAMQLLIKKADGSFRDGVKLLDQLSTIGKKITADDITVNLGAVMFEQIYGILDSISVRNGRESILLLHKLTEGGADIKVLMMAIMDMMRGLLFIKSDLGLVLVSEEYTSDKYESLQKLAAKFEESDLIESLKILQEASEKLKFSSIPSLPLELALLEICNIEHHGQIQLHEESQKIETVDSENQIEVDKSGVETQSAAHFASDVSKLKEKWTFVLETIRPFNFSLEALLRSISIAQCTETKIYMEVPYSFHQRIIEAPKNRDILESVFSDILGRNVQIATVLGKRSQRREDLANIEVAQDDEIIRVAAEIFNSDSIN